MAKKHFSMVYIDQDFNGYQTVYTEHIEDVLDDMANLGCYHFELDRKLYSSTIDDDMVKDGDEWKLVNPDHVFLFDALIHNANPILKAAWNKRFSEMIEWGKTARNGDTFDFLGIEITCEIEE